MRKRKKYIQFIGTQENKYFALKARILEMQTLKRLQLPCP